MCNFSIESLTELVNIKQYAIKVEQKFVEELGEPTIISAMCIM